MEPITSATLVVTEQCNFNCRYCFVHQHPHVMTLQVAKDCIDYLRQSPSVDRHITFFGGEPMLEYERIIKPLVEYAGNEFDYNITTNGSLLTDKSINFFKDHNFHILLSMDGAEVTQNYNRHNNSFGFLNAIIPEILPIAGFRATIIPATCKYTFENMIYAERKGFDRIFMAPNIFEPWSEEAKAALEFEIKKYALYYIHSFVNDKKVILLTPFIEMIKDILWNELGYDLSLNEKTCGIGNGAVAINYKGDIYTCQEVVTCPESEHFKIGSIYTGIDEERRQALAAEIINDQPMTGNLCDTCNITWCKKNICQANNYMACGSCLRQSDVECWWNQLLYKYAVFAIQVLQGHEKFIREVKDYGL